MYGAGKLRLANAAQSKSANQGCNRTPAAPLFSTPRRRAGLPTSSFLIRSCNSCKKSHQNFSSNNTSNAMRAHESQQYMQQRSAQQTRAVLKKAGISYRTSQMACTQHQPSQSPWCCNSCSNIFLVLSNSG